MLTIVHVPTGSNRIQHENVWNVAEASWPQATQAAAIQHRTRCWLVHWPFFTAFRNGYSGYNPLRSFASPSIWANTSQQRLSSEFFGWFSLQFCLFRDVAWAGKDSKTDSSFLAMGWFITDIMVTKYVIKTHQVTAGPACSFHLSPPMDHAPSQHGRHPELAVNCERGSAWRWAWTIAPSPWDCITWTVFTLHLALHTPWPVPVPVTISMPLHYTMLHWVYSIHTISCIYKMMHRSYIHLFARASANIHHPTIP